MARRVAHRGHSPRRIERIRGTKGRLVGLSDESMERINRWMGIVGGVVRLVSSFFFASCFRVDRQVNWTIGSWEYMTSSFQDRGDIGLPGTGRPGFRQQRRTTIQSCFLLVVSDRTIALLNPSPPL
jgi:hypothetical protein